MYTLIVIIAIIFSLLLTPPGGKEKRSLYSFIYFTLWSLIFVTIAFRGEYIGRDTINYINKYATINEASSYSSFGGLGAYEPLFFYLNRLFGRLFGAWSQSVMVAESVAIVACYGAVLKRHSINPIISVLAFLSFGLYAASFCLLRQFIAMSFCVWSLKYVFERKPIKFYLFTLIAVGFHYTALFWFVVYFLCVNLTKLKKSDWIYALVAIIGYLFVGMFQEATSHITERWSGYSDLETGAEGIISFLIFFLITVLAFINRDTIKSNYRNGGALLALNYINIIFWTMRLVTRNAERLALFFTIAPILLIPILIDVIEKKNGRVVGAFFKFVVVVLLAVFFVYKFQRDSSIYPYQFMTF